MAPLTCVTATLSNPLQLEALTSQIHGDDPPRLPPGHLELLIATHLVELYQQPPEQITSDALAQSSMTTTIPSQSIGPTHPTGLLIGPLVDLLRYSNEEKSQWLIDIAHDICGPVQKRGRLIVQRNQDWQDVHATDPLIASTYQYIVGHTVSLTKISARVGRSRIDATGEASTMANRVKNRDGQKCWVTRRRPVTISHISPKRMGDHMLRGVYNTFVQTPPQPTLSAFDELCGISLFVALTHLFDKYEFGLRFMALDEYECHFFPPDGWPPGDRLSQFGYIETPEDTPSDAPSLHRIKITSPPLPDGYKHPPPGLFRWHYLQCVIRKFAHTDYRSLQHIYHPELDLPMEGDSDDEGTDSEFEWPSAPLDLGRAMLETIEAREEQRRVVAEWVSHSVVQ